MSNYPDNMNHSYLDDSTPQAVTEAREEIASIENSAKQAAKLAADYMKKHHCIDIDVDYLEIVIREDSAVENEVGSLIRTIHAEGYDV